MVVVSCVGDDAGETSGPSTGAVAEPVGDGADELSSSGPSSVSGADLERLADVEGPAWEPATRTDELLAEIGASEEGPTVQHLVDAFALLVDDMPGATPTDLPPGDGIGSTYTLRSIDARRGELTDEQVAVLDDYLELGTLVGTISADGNVEVSPEFSGDDPPDPLTTTSSVAGFRSPRSSDDPPVEVGVPVELEYVVLLDEVRADWKEHAPALPAHEVEIYITPDVKGGMDATLRPDPLGEVCSIRVHAGFFQQIPPAETVRDFFAHELFHCMQMEWWTDVDPPPWVVEGSANWAAADLYRSRHAGTRSLLWSGWFTSPDKALAERSYDAWPFFENVRLSGRPTYATIRQMFEEPQPSVGAYLSVLGLDGELFRKDWSSRSLRTPSMGALWHVAWPSKDEDVGPVDNGFSLGERGLGVYNINGAGRFTHLQLVVTMTSDVGVVTVTPVGSPLTSYTAIGTQTVGDGATRSFCFAPDGCACPSGQSSGATPMLGDDMVFSFAASLMVKHSAVRAEAWDPDKRCRDAKQPATASSDGDPHLVSFDGLPFDIITLGEFVLARDPVGDFEVQTRHEPIGFGTGTTAVAVGTGDHRVTFTRADFGSVGDLVVRLDGDAVSQSDFSVGDAQVTLSGTDVEMSWPDGSVVDLNWFSGWFVRVTVPPERAARMEGLVGSSDGDLSNDLAMPDGTLLDTTDVEIDESPYSLAWAVRGDTTLFDYDPAQSLATFRRPHPIPVPPAIDAPIRERCVDALGQRAAAHEVDACAYDVSATGDEGFVGQYVEIVDRRVRATGAVIVPDIPATAEPAVGAAGRAGEPTIILGPEQRSGAVTAAAGTVLLVRTASCDPDAGTREVGELDVRVERVDDRGLVAVAALCDPTGLASIGLPGGAERFDGEAYVWLPGSGDYGVTVEQTSGAVDAIGTIEVFIDPTPTVVLAADIAATDRRVLDGIGDTVVYLPEPGTRFDADGVERACAVEVYWLADEFPDDEPFDLESCGHPSTVGSPGNRLVPIVVFNRDGGRATVEVRRRG